MPSLFVLSPADVLFVDFIYMKLTETLNLTQGFSSSTPLPAHFDSHGLSSDAVIQVFKSLGGGYLKSVVLLPGVPVCG